MVDELAALDDRRLRFKLKRPFPRLLAALANPSNPAAFIMPERIARTDPFQQIRETVGSGPFKFLAGEYNSGSFAAYRAERRLPAGLGRAEPDRGGEGRPFRPRRVAHHHRCGDRLGGAAERRDRLVRAAAAGDPAAVPAQPRHHGGGDRPPAQSGGAALQPPAPALQRQEDAPGPPAGGQPDRLHDGDRGPRPGALLRHHGHLHPGHAAGQRRRDGGADRTAQHRPLQGAAEGGRLYQPAHPADRPDRHPGAGGDDPGGGRHVPPAGGEPRLRR